MPFDRHDWVVDRAGEDVRYVVDFYSGKKEEGKPVAVHIDARPALDSVGALVDRLRWWVTGGSGFVSVDTVAKAREALRASNHTAPTMNDLAQYQAAMEKGS